MSSNREERLAIAVEELLTALRLTVEYVGIQTLPPKEGWAWWDVYLKYAPPEWSIYMEEWYENVSQGRFGAGVAAAQGVANA